MLAAARGAVRDLLENPVFTNHATREHDWHGIGQVVGASYGHPLAGQAVAEISQRPGLERWVDPREPAP
jgi:hypothetical protein